MEPKAVEQHYAQVELLSHSLSPEVAKSATVLDFYPDALRTDIIFSPDLRVIFHTRQETNKKSVRFVTCASRVSGNKRADMDLKAFNVRRG
jgi:hypothetical protein